MAEAIHPPPHIAVILSTYNQPAWLEKVLWGYAAQSTSHFELLLADDGSAAATARVVDHARAAFGGRLRHLWQRDEGFRKCEILNQAIAATDSPYLLFSDGDCIPRRDFVETHARLARPGAFLSGGVIWLPLETSQRITESDIVSGRIADGTWLAANGWPAGRRRLRLVRSQAAGAFFDALSPTGATFNGHNASAWRVDVMRANGFDAEMGYGGLDRALGERLVNLGVRGTRVRFRAVCFHLDHARGYRRTEVMERNREIRSRIRANQEVRARLGIAELTEPAIELQGDASDPHPGQA
jgi:glycosyltransferase involved in cell wall biosynthesis